MSRKYYWADTHFDHFNIIRYCYRDYKSAEEMNNDLIAKWNNKVAKNDLIYIIGDFTLSHNQTRIKELLTRLNGIKHLVSGNHDRKNPEGFASVNDYLSIRDSYMGISYRVILFHYPIESWLGSYEKDMRGDNSKIPTVHLHGHSHDLAAIKLNRYDVGVDTNLGCNGPVTLKEILENERTRLLS